jgi:ABC-type lipoprotein release transport system permease subunit
VVAWGGTTVRVMTRHVAPWLPARRAARLDPLVALRQDN